MRRLAWIVLTCSSIPLAACGPDKADDKGVVDTSEPPGIPSEPGKFDEASQTVAVDVQSAHPYTNSASTRHRVDLGVLPGCATDARLHFAVLRTEPGYDFVSVEPVGDATQSFDGDRDGTWTEWFRINAGYVDVWLDTDSSITRHGFAIDQIEWDGMPADCPVPRAPPCTAGFADTAPRPGVCECPVDPECAPLDQIQIRHSLGRAFNIHAKQTAGAEASTTHPGLVDEQVVTVVGTIALDGVEDLVERAAASGVLHGAGYDRPITSGEFREELTITAGTHAVTFVATQGTHDPEVAALITGFEGLFSCSAGGGLTCGDGFECGADGACVESATCACPANWDPQCGVDGHTYSNACAAGCANMAIAHAGECGQVGDMCGGLQGLPCVGDNRCRYDASTFEAPFPDAAGSCVAVNYCDAPVDCMHLPHIAVPGSWACAANACGWQAGLAWKPVTDGRFETAHPYASSTSVWTQIYLPAEAQAMRLVPVGSFRLEPGYDFLEVWTWQSGAWRRVQRYTGATAPATVELAGRYHYLHFVSDSSITDTGFVLDAEWR
jgi:hypothetical protein